MLEDCDIEKLVEHAKTRRWGPGSTQLDYTNPYHILCYASEQLAQYAHLLDFPSLPQSDRDQVFEKLVFMNGVMGRIAHNEATTMSSSSYTHFKRYDGTNQIDDFLARIGYRPPGGPG